MANIKFNQTNETKTKIMNRLGQLGLQPDARMMQTLEENINHLNRLTSLFNALKKPILPSMTDSMVLLRVMLLLRAMWLIYSGFCMKKELMLPSFPWSFYLKLPNQKLQLDMECASLPPLTRLMPGL